MPDLMTMNPHDLAPLGFAAGLCLVLPILGLMAFLSDRNSPKARQRRRRKQRQVERRRAQREGYGFKS